MQSIKYLLILLCVFHQAVYAAAHTAPDESAPLTLIVYESHTQSRSNNGGGNSETRSAILERRLGRKDGGLELEYSNPQSDVPEIEAWILPARVMIVPGSSIKLLNESEISDRLEKYLVKHPDIRKLCGKILFTWTAVEIHCSTSHVIDVIKGYNLNLGALFEGKLYEEPGTLSPVPLKLKRSGNKNLVYQANLALDPKFIQDMYEKSMKQASKITGSSYESMMQSALNLTGEEKPEFSGTKLVTIVATPTGYILKLKRETITKIKGGKDFQEIRTVKETLERRSAD